ncbi:hypothetical protein HOY82DRAFT_589933 [Tuber indicum]|nr:hypothetical protein HOY82DRAFT_589933 [Tuber indicum]
MCFCNVYTLTACPRLHKIKCYYRLCSMHMHLLPPFSQPPSPSPSPRKLRTTPSYEHLAEALNPVGTPPRVPGFPTPEEKVAYLHCIEAIVPYPSPPQEVRLAKAGCGLSGCRKPDTVGGMGEAWNGKTEDGEARFGCPVCKAEEVKAEGEFWVEIAAGVGLPGDDHVKRGEGEGSANARAAAGGGLQAPPPPLVYTPSPAEIARRNRPGPPCLPTMVIPKVSAPKSMSSKSMMGRSRPTTLGSPTPPLPEDSA